MYLEPHSGVPEDAEARQPSFAPIGRGIGNTAWMNARACHDVDPELFTPDHPTPDVVERAIVFCRACPVREQCRQFAHGLNPPAYGVWGGQWRGPWSDGHPAPVDPADVTALLRLGLSSRKVAAKLGCTFEQVRWIRRKASRDAPPSPLVAVGSDRYRGSEPQL